MFAVYFRGENRHDPLNGACAPVAGGREFSKLWPEAEPEEFSGMTVAESVDAMGIGGTIRFSMWQGAIDVTRQS